MEGFLHERTKENKNQRQKLVPNLGFGFLRTDVLGGGE